MFDLRLADGLSQNPSASTAALKSGASRARYAAMGLDRGEASETIGNGLDLPRFRGELSVWDQAI